MEKKKKKFRISGKLIFNLIVFGITIYLAVFFFVSEDGLIDLLSTPNSFSLGWIIIAFLVYDFNILIDVLNIIDDDGCKLRYSNDGKGNNYNEKPCFVRSDLILETTKNLYDFLINQI